MKRDIRLIAHDPAVVRDRRDMEELVRMQLDHTAIVECNRRAPRQHHPDMLNRTTCCPDLRPCVFTPAPPWFVGRAPDRHSAELDDLELTFREQTGFVR